MTWVKTCSGVGVTRFQLSLSPRQECVTQSLGSSAVTKVPPNTVA